jgi:hypothetical protein
MKQDYIWLLLLHIFGEVYYCPSHFLVGNTEYHK